jgi:hypothetical protein
MLWAPNANRTKSLAYFAKANRLSGSPINDPSSESRLFELPSVARFGHIDRTAAAGASVRRSCRHFQLSAPRPDGHVGDNRTYLQGGRQEWMWLMPEEHSRKCPAWDRDNRR